MSNTSNTDNSNNVKAPTDGKPLRREIGALWKRTSSVDGREYLTGKLQANQVDEFADALRTGDLKIILFENTKKENEKAPDYHILMAKDQYEAVAGPLPPNGNVKTSPSPSPRAASPAFVSPPPAKIRPAAKPAPAPVAKDDDDGIL